MIFQACIYIYIYLYSLCIICIIYIVRYLIPKFQKHPPPTTQPLFILFAGPRFARIHAHQWGKDFLGSHKFLSCPGESMWNPGPKDSFDAVHYGPFLERFRNFWVKIECIGMCRVCWSLAGTVTDDNVCNVPVELWFLLCSVQPLMSVNVNLCYS